METDQMASSVSELQAIIKNIDGEISRLQTLIVGEDDKMLRYKVRPGSSTSFKCSFVFVNSYGYIQERAGFLVRWYVLSVLHDSGGILYIHGHLLRLKTSEENTTICP